MEESVPRGDPLDDYATVEVYEDEAHPDIFIDPNASIKAHGEAAKDALPKTQGASVMEQVQVFVEKALKEEPHTFPLPPYDQILHDEKYWLMLSDCLGVIERYRMQGFDAWAHCADQDLAHLYGNLTYLSGVVGYLNASVEHADSSKKILHARVYRASKVARDRLGVSVTDSDATKLADSRVLALAQSREHLQLMAKTITNSYYAIRSFAEELGRIVSRTHRTEKNASYVKQP